MNNGFKKFTQRINISIDEYNNMISNLGKKKLKPKQEEKVSKIREFLFKKVL